jgi:hypothetical protein
MYLRSKGKEKKKLFLVLESEILKERERSLQGMDLFIYISNMIQDHVSFFM